MLRSMLCLGRDNYSSEGIDVVPERPPRQDETIPGLVKLLQGANRREEQVRPNANALNRKYHSLYQEYMALKHNDYCDACQLKKDTTPEGDTFTLKESKPLQVLNSNWKRKKNEDCIGKTVMKQL